MKRFMRRALRRRQQQPSDSRRPDASAPTRNKKSYLRLPILGAMSFPSRRPSNAESRRRAAFSDLDANSSAKSLQPASLRSVGELGRAPIFYDMYDPQPDDLVEPPPASVDLANLRAGRVVHEVGNAAHELDEVETGSADVSTHEPDTPYLSDQRQPELSPIQPPRDSTRERKRASLRRTRNIHSRIAVLDTVRPKKSPAPSSSSDRSRLTAPTTRAGIRDEYDDETFELDYESDVTGRGEHDPAFDLDGPESAQFSRRVKTVIAEPISGKTRAATQGQRPYRKIEESPYSEGTRLSQRGTNGHGECKLYHAYTDALQKEARGRAGGLRIIVDLLRDSDGNPIVIEKAALAIGILSENDAATRDVFGQHSAVQSLIQCLSMRMPSKYDKSKIVSSVAFAIACLLKESPRNVRLFETFDGPHKMGKAAASERYENCPAVPKHALKALSELKHHPSHATESFGHMVSSSSSTTSRTIRYVLRAMTLHEHRTNVQEHGLDALRTLLSRAGKGALNTEMLELSAQATGTAFKMHSESREIQWQCLTLLCDLDDLREGLFSLELDVESFFGALRLVIVDAKVNGSRKPKLGQALLGLIRRAVDVAVNNGWRSQEFKDSAVEAGAVETVLDALDAYGDDPQIVDKICTILRVLLQSDEGRFRMNSVNAACAILSGIETVNERSANMLPS